MDTQIIALLMFLLLTYLLFRRPASAPPKRYPTELDFQIGHSVLLERELLKGNATTMALRGAAPNSLPRQPRKADYSKGSG
jgi:hypothetical protein